MEQKLNVSSSTLEITQPNIASVKAPIARKLYHRGSEAGSTLCNSKSRVQTATLESRNGSVIGSPTNMHQRMQSFNNT